MKIHSLSRRGARDQGRHRRPGRRHLHQRRGRALPQIACRPPQGHRGCPAPERLGTRRRTSRPRTRPGLPEFYLSYWSGLSAPPVRRWMSRAPSAQRRGRDRHDRPARAPEARQLVQCFCHATRHRSAQGLAAFQRAESQGWPIIKAARHQTKETSRCTDLAGTTGGRYRALPNSSPPARRRRSWPPAPFRPRHCAAPVAAPRPPARAE